MCERLEIPYLDFGGARYETKDGSHLTLLEARRLCRQLVEWVGPLLAPRGAEPVR